jgi:hypothetical protein
MLLDLTQQRLGWPKRSEIVRPPGEGPRTQAELAQAKLGPELARHPDARDGSIGVLAPDPASANTESPLSIVCEFRNPVSDQTVRDLHRLAWNFSRSPMLVTVEPHRLRAWTCCEPPNNQRSTDEYMVKELTAAALQAPPQDRETFAAAQTLHWVNLVSSRFFQDEASRFPRSHRADRMLLANLQDVRLRLKDEGLTSDDICHDLLARIIFIQFLFDRKDSHGRAALNPEKLGSLRATGVLRASHDSFASVLSDYGETYRLFDWLNVRFNGDLFAGKGDTDTDRQRAWHDEQLQVQPRHLALLQYFVSGKLDMPAGQYCLWPQYAFDAIPLEFISSIYEAFVKDRARKGGIYYTPPHVVDFMLDRVLPWGGTEWDLKVLDPACGSGVFLVKVLQRLIHRWKKAHPGEDIRAEDVRRLLENNIFGVDKDPHAVRVASFSLYLAMCDEIDPKHYWTQVRFPPMRERRLVHADFFQEGRGGFSTASDAGTYDLVVGNAPWGEELLTVEAKEWAEDRGHAWPVVNKGIGLLFLPKAAALAKPSGRVSMVQSAGSFLFNRSGPARAFRERFFSRFQVDEVVNLSALRFELFARKASAAQSPVAPSCIVTFRPCSPVGDDIWYASPKRSMQTGPDSEIMLDPDDLKCIRAHEAASAPEIWPALMWGSRRDWALTRRLAGLTCVRDLMAKGVLAVEEGVIRGTDPIRRRRCDWLVGRRIVEDDGLFATGFPTIHAEAMPLNDDASAERGRSESAFSPPQLLIKEAWSAKGQRFQARLVLPDRYGHGALCTQSYLSVHAQEGAAATLDAVCLSYNSILAVYFLLLTSSRFASYRPEPLVEELLCVPIPEPRPGLLDGIATPRDVDDRVRDAFGFKDAEWVLVDDLFNVTLPDFKGDARSPGRRPTQRVAGAANEQELRQYCEYFIRVLKTGLGATRAVVATIFQEVTLPYLPYRLVAFSIGGRKAESVQVQALESPRLVNELERLNRILLRTERDDGRSVYSRRTARVYSDMDGVPAIYIIKPDACRYWTRSMGLHDADEVAADFVSWHAASESTLRRKGRLDA